MGLRGDERGAAIQVGFVILFGFIVLAMAMYQASVVPGQNEQVEFNHNQLVRGQMQDVRNGIVSIPGGGPDRSVSVKLGTTYPERTVFVNPPPPSGQLRTTPAARLRIENATADGEVGDFWNGTGHAYWTRGLVYRPDYHEYERGPATAYENTLVYDAQPHGDRLLVRSDQRLVDGRRITLVTLNGTYQRASTRTVSVDLEAESTSTNVVAVRNDTAPITLTLPTRLPESKWREVLEDEFVAEGGHVTSVSTTPVSGEPYHLVHVTLEAGVSYSLRMAKVGVGTNVRSPRTAYVTDVSGDGTTARVGENVTLVAEVRDRFNNPYAGQLVNATVVSGGGTVTPASDTSDADGRVEFVFNGTSPGTSTVQVSYGPDPNASDARHVNFTVNVRAGAGGGYSISWDRPTRYNGPSVTCSGSSCTWDAGADSDGVLDLRASTSPSTAGVTANFGVDNGTVATVSPSTNTTNGAGEVWTTLSPSANGTANVTVSSGTSSDVVEIQVTNVSAGANSPPTASFTDDDGDDTVPTGETVNFDASVSDDPDGSIVSYAWDFDDGTTDTGVTTAHAWSDDGTYTVTLTVTDDDGATDTETRTFAVNNRPPTARFDYSPRNPDVGQTVTFDAGNSSDPDGGVASYQWDFGDGTTATGKTVSHSYASAGDYTVTLTVTDDDGATDTTSANVTVSANDAPNVAFDYSPSSPTTGETVAFDASGSNDTDGSIVSYDWDFDGDGSVDASTASATINHTYAGAGNYTVELTVTDDDGATNATTRTVSVQNRPPTASLSANDTAVLTYEDVAFDASGSSDPDGTIVEYRWDFDGDGANDTTTGDPTVVHNYSQEGTYTATVWVVDNDSATDSASVDVTVDNRAPNANFTYSCRALTCTFNDTSTDRDGSVSSWSWELGDGTTATTRNVTHDYPSPGNYTVNLTVTDDDGATGTVSKTVEVEDTLRFVNDSALAFKGERGGGGGQTAVLLFNVTNNRSDTVNVTAVTVERTDPADTSEVYEGHGNYAELMVDNDGDENIADGLAEAGDSGTGYAIGTEMVLATEVRHRSGRNLTVQLFQFKDSTGKNTDISDNNVTITVRYRDSEGDVLTSTFTIPASEITEVNAGAPLG